MAAIRKILNVYEKADSAKKVDIIIRYYPNFLGIVNSYTEGLLYMIENEKAYNRSKNRGDLGVREQICAKYLGKGTLWTKEDCKYQNIRGKDFSD